MLRQYLRVADIARSSTHTTSLFSTHHTNLFDSDTEIAIVHASRDDDLLAQHLDTATLTSSPTATTFRTKSVVSSNWSINNNPNGGFSMAMCISAARNVQSFRDHLTATCHYHSALQEGVPALFQTHILKQGKQMSTVNVGVYQQGKQKINFVGTFGDLNALTGVSREEEDEDNVTKPIHTMSDFEDCTDTLWTGLNHLNVGTLYSNGVKVWVPKTSPFLQTLMVGKAKGEPRIEAWVEFLDGRDPCLRSLALFNDCLPPAVLNYAGLSAWVPTIEYTVHSYRRPVPGPMKLSFRADVIRNGIATVNGEVQDSQGNLCSVSRQMCTIRV